MFRSQLHGPMKYCLAFVTRVHKQITNPKQSRSFGKVIFLDVVNPNNSTC